MIKSVLLTALLSFSALLATSQNVLVKDSSVSSPNGTTYALDDVTTYTYTTKCKVASSTSRTNQNLFDYYPDDNVYHVIVLTRGTPTEPFVNETRITYTYTPAKKVATAQSESWNGTGWDPSTLVSYTYDANNYPTRVVTQQWDAGSNMYQTLSQTDFYNRANGLVDSSITTLSTTISKSYYTYYTTNQVYQVVGNIFLAGQQASSSRQTYKYDSSGNVHTDSVITESALPPFTTYTLASTTATVTTYNADKTIKEEDVVTKAAGSSFYTKTFYTYGPCSSVLPVTFVSFTGKLQDKNALLYWQTATETNASHFTIERSANGKDFAGVGKVIANNSMSQNSYTFTDATASLANATDVYYRLAETDKNGAVSYSKIIRLSLAEGKVHIYVSPNPVGNTITLYSPETIMNAVVTIADTRGKTVYSAKQNLSAGNRTTIDASALAKGMYIITVQSATGKQQLKIVK